MKRTRRTAWEMKLQIQRRALSMSILPACWVARSVGVYRGCTLTETSSTERRVIGLSVRENVTQ